MLMKEVNVERKSHVDEKSECTIGISHKTATFGLAGGLASALARFAQVQIDTF